VDPARQPRLLQEIRGHVAASLGVGAASLRDDETLLGGLLDSIGLLTLTVRLEETYRITISGNEIDAANLGTIRALADFVSRKTEAT
jgi:acyl carrier protein